MDVVGPEPHGQQVQATLAGRPVEQGHALERIRIEQVGKVADGVREVDEPTLVGPLLIGLGISDREDEVRDQPPGLERGHEVGHNCFLRIKDELDLLAAVLLEGGDDLPDRRVLLGGLSLLPPHHEVGGLCAERRHGERRRQESRLECARCRLPDQING